jgi:serine phosphatase RsbU (regulator of sigma subunit)/DNA-binding NarL/FixJ family response regulator
MSKIRVLLVDDHAVVRSGLSGFLMAFDEFELVGEANSGEAAIELCQKAQPHVVLMDLVMPGMNGAAATRQIRQKHPHIQVLALTSYKEKNLIEDVLDAGAIGYLLKNVAIDELAEAIRAAHHGKPTISPELSQIIVQAERLEKLSRAILDEPLDQDRLRDLLREHVPHMVPDCRIEIKMFPAEWLLQHPSEGPRLPESLWNVIQAESHSRSLSPEELAAFGWEGQEKLSIVFAPIESPGADGSVVIVAPPARAIEDDLLPIARALSAQVSMAIQNVRAREQSVEYEKVAQELALAGTIQRSFLPAAMPKVAGYQFAGMMIPAKETAGDFYDFITLPDGSLGLIIADVADKGMGAALYMTMSRALMRTFAPQMPNQPARVLQAVNQRLLSDASAGLFVSMVYGVLDPSTGFLTYTNAGHPPPIQFPSGIKLIKTGPVLGVDPAMAWDQSTIRIQPGEHLLGYTDGILDALDSSANAYGLERLMAAATASSRSSAAVLCEGVLEDVKTFVGNAARFDDITLVALYRE